MPNWTTEIMEARREVLDESDKIGCTLSDVEMDDKFSEGADRKEPKPFIYWTKDRIYFSVTHDGWFWVDSVPRNPCNEVRSHSGR